MACTSSQKITVDKGAKQSCRRLNSQVGSFVSYVASEPGQTANLSRTKHLSKPKFIDLFAGCGGLSLGLLSSGWEGVFAVEKNEDAFSTLKANLVGRRKLRFNWPTWLPVQPTTTSELIDTYGSELGKLRGQIDLIAGGPPCQGYSFAGKRNANDPRNKLKDEYIELVNIIRPRFLMFENVRGFSSSFGDDGGDAHADIIRASLRDFEWGGYQVFSQVLKASQFGVPQPRPRFILLAIRSDLTSNLPPTDPFEGIGLFASSFRLRRGLNGHEISVKEAISDIEVAACGVTPSKETSGFQQIRYSSPASPTAFQKLMRKGVGKGTVPNSLRLARHRPDTLKRFNDILKNCPKGTSLSKELREHYSMKKQCFTPLHPDQLSKTITTLPDDLLHYSEARILTVRESARIQTFPDWFAFQGKYTTGGSRRRDECPRYTQVGNAVPPLMAEALGELVLSSFHTAQVEMI